MRFQYKFWIKQYPLLRGIIECEFHDYEEEEWENKQGFEIYGDDLVEYNEQRIRDFVKRYNEKKLTNET